MRIATRYTLEDWETGEMSIHHIPDSVLSQSFEEVLTKSFGYLRSIELNPIELLFLCIFLHNDWRVIRPPMSQDGPVQQHTVVAIERVTGVVDALYGPGVPDFFLWNPAGKHRFVEIKASEDSLNKNQREWADIYDRNFAIGQLAPASVDLSDEEIIEENRIT